MPARRCCEPELGLDLRSVLYPAPADAADAARQLDQTFLTQPALFAVEYALACFWRSWGLEPAAMIGHSLGRIRGRLPGRRLHPRRRRGAGGAPGRSRAVPSPGRMLAVRAPASELEGLLPPDVSVAAINSPTLTVVSGKPEAIHALDEDLRSRDVACRALATSHAFHSAMLDPILEPFEALVRAFDRRPPQAPLGLERHRRLDHRGAGDGSDVLGPPAPGAGALPGRPGPPPRRSRRDLARGGAGAASVRPGAPAPGSWHAPRAHLAAPRPGGRRRPRVIARAPRAGSGWRVYPSTGPSCTVAPGGASACPPIHSNASVTGLTPRRSSREGT